MKTNVHFLSWRDDDYDNSNFKNRNINYNEWIMKTKFICENNIWLINLNNMSNKIVQRYNSAHFQTSTTFENYEKNEFFFQNVMTIITIRISKIETLILLRKMLCHRLFQKKQKFQLTSNLKIIVKNRKKKN